MLNGIPLSASSAGPAFTWMGQGKFLGWLPYPVIFMIIVSVFSVILITKTKFGRQVYAIGSNENTAFLSGLKVKSIKFRVYMLSAALSASPTA